MTTVEYYQQNGYSPCGNSWYFPSVQQCQGDAVYIQCGNTGNYYNLTTQECSYVISGGTVIYSILEKGQCGNALYNTSSQRCGANNVVETQCGTSSGYYNSITHACYNEPYNGTASYTIVEKQKCNGGNFEIQKKCLSGISYNPETQFCNGSEVLDRCTQSGYLLPYYDPTVLFCYNGLIQLLCSGSKYDLETHFCQYTTNVLLKLCGGDTYTSSQFCYKEEIHTKCDNKEEYNPETQRCYNRVVQDQCGTGWYDTETEQCYHGTSGSVSYEGQTYKTVGIGTQMWMAENLNYNVSGSLCYGGDDSNCVKYGRLYDWATAMALPSSCNSNNINECSNWANKGICPDGWHVPTEWEWYVLYNYVGGADVAGRHLKATEGWTSCNSSGSVGNFCEDTYGFKALPGGLRASNFSDINVTGRWWTSSGDTYERAYYRQMTNNSESSSMYESWFKQYFASIRCMKD
jgi:uncharacterized protein (TIGR02145 family)